MPDDWKPGTGQKIETLYAWVATEADGGEGVLSMTVPGLGTTPMIGADTARVESLRPKALQVGKTLNVPIALKRFSQVETLEEYKP